MVNPFLALSQAKLKVDEEQESLSPQLHDHNSAPFDDNDAEFFGDGKYHICCLYFKLC
jgi:hypothetical protein